MTRTTILALFFFIIFIPVVLSPSGCSDDGSPTPDARTDTSTTDGPVADGPVADGPVVDGPKVDGLKVDGPAVDQAASDSTGLDLPGTPDQAISDASPADAGSPTGTWALQLGNSHKIGADTAGNTYIAGTFTGTATFGTTTLTGPAGKTSLYLAKLDDKGAFLWVKSPATSAGNVTLDDFTVDGGGTCFISGLLEGTTTFGSKSLAAGGYVAKVSTAGAVAWATPVGGLGPYDYLRGVAVDGAGNSYVTGGAWSGTATLGTFTVTTKIFVAKLDASGTFVWVAQGPMNVHASDIAADAAGNTYLGGFHKGNATLGSTTVSCSWGQCAIVAKISSSGAFVWATSGADIDSFPSIGVDGSGGSYLAGVVKKPISGPAIFGTQSVTLNRNEIFVARLTSSGAFAWVQTSKSTNGSNTLTGIAVDSAGNSHITGSGSYTQIGSATVTTSSRIYLARLDTAGSFTWAVFPPVPTAPPCGSGSGESIALGSGGTTAHITGNFSGNVTFGSKTLSSPPGHFIATLDAASGAF